jgi:hypothetical protein
MRRTTAKSTKGRFLDGKITARWFFDSQQAVFDGLAPPKWPPWLLYGPKYQLWMSVTPMPVSHPIHHQITGWRASQLQPSMIWGVTDLCFSAFRLRAWEHFSEATQASKVASVGARWSRHVSLGVFEPQMVLSISPLKTMVAGVSGTNLAIINHI